MFESSGIYFSGQLRIRNILLSAYSLHVISLQFIHERVLICFILFQCHIVADHSLKYYILDKYFYSNLEGMNFSFSRYRSS
jgi:hypothetical protein